MKRYIFIFLLAFLGVTLKGASQAFEIKQLLLNVEKLAQLKQILQDLKKGYEIVSAGYNTIKNISQGNFDLHKTFLDGLMEVSPTVKNYKRVSDIVQCQILIVNEYKNAYRRFRQDDNFNPEEIKYLGSVYTNLFNQSLKNLDELAVILTSGDLRMSDDERLKAVDEIFGSMQDKLLFLRQFNNKTAMLSIQRAREKRDIHASRRNLGLTR